MFWWEALCVVKSLSFRVQVLRCLMLPSNRFTPFWILCLRLFFIDVDWLWRGKTWLDPIAFKCTYFGFGRHPSLITSANLLEHKLIIIFFIARGCSCSRESVHLVCQITCWPSQSMCTRYLKLSALYIGQLLLCYLKSFVELIFINHHSLLSS